MSDEVKTSHVTDFMKFAIGLSMTAAQVDEGGYIVKPDGERISVQDGAPLIVYQEKVTDISAQILNPFSEGINETAPSIWFYKMLLGSLFVRVRSLMMAVVEYAAEEQRQVHLTAEEKKKSKVKPLHLPPVLAHLVSTIVQHVDAKTASELDVLDKHSRMPNTTNGLVYLLYVKKMLTTRLSIPIIEQGDDYELPAGIRKGTLPVFRTLLMAIFGLKTPGDLSRFLAKADEDATPKIDSMMRCLFRVYDQLNPALDAFDSTFSIDMSEFKHHLERMPAYSQNARSIVSVAPRAAPIAQQYAPQTGVGTGQQPQSATAAPRSPNALPQFVRADGSWGPMVEVAAGPSWGYTGPPMPTQAGPQNWGGGYQMAAPPSPGYGTAPAYHNGGGSIYDQAPPPAAAPIGPWMYPTGANMPGQFR